MTHLKSCDLSSKVMKKQKLDSIGTLKKPLGVTYRLLMTIAHRVKGKQHTKQKGEEYGNSYS
jgi:hypothetical protein